MSYEQALTAEKLNEYFADLSKQIKKVLGRNSNVELILVGGSSILLNYDFRPTTMDADAFVRGGQPIREAIIYTADKNNLSPDWLNTDFVKTTSYSAKLSQYSKFYKRYNQVLTVRTVTDEYLVAMKLKSFRPYKFDWSDIVGIIYDMSLRKPIELDAIKTAVVNLYGDWNSISLEAQQYIKHVIQNTEKLPEIYNQIRSSEQYNKIVLQEFENEYSGVLTSDNLEDILKSLTHQKNVVPKIQTLDELIEEKSTPVNHKKIISCKSEPTL